MYTHTFDFISIFPSYLLSNWLENGFDGFCVENWHFLLFYYFCHEKYYTLLGKNKEIFLINFLFCMIFLTTTTTL